MRWRKADTHFVFLLGKFERGLISQKEFIQDCAVQISRKSSCLTGNTTIHELIDHDESAPMILMAVVAA
jgi:hypothetical protein